eukprot:362606-Chlamydomonas_euryale.AAC.8
MLFMCSVHLCDGHLGGQISAGLKSVAPDCVERHRRYEQNPDVKLSCPSGMGSSPTPVPIFLHGGPNVCCATFEYPNSNLERNTERTHPRPSERMPGPVGSGCVPTLIRAEVGNIPLKEKLNRVRLQVKTRRTAFRGSGWKLLQSTARSGVRGSLA